LVHQGLTLAIVGRPNVGKSSLFNRLVERERAIVTAQPGTTRDLISETVAIGGIPVELVDTAGIRQAPDDAEARANWATYLAVHGRRDQALAEYRRALAADPRCAAARRGIEMLAPKSDEK